MTDDTPLKWPPVAGSEIDTLLGSLERQRRTFAWKADGLDAAGLQATVGASTMTIGGLLNHLALVEDDYFTRRLVDGDMPEPWRSVDWDADPDWEWRTAADETPEALQQRWRESVRRSRVATREALEDNGAGTLMKIGWPNGETPSLRSMLAGLIEEYARHTGHADLIREAVDGRVGEDPPDDFVIA
ncbi:mycothiol transferase [Luteipulveratus halotolerans]|uniref:Mini-circle protein n=1 Tax=Luteipulveratus halotolerans TaxID=1631356 RepID=A0A0L6CIV7_9MICO|nr:DUF664 domain-containing protein [Luteipulveratus halotolerans]KNX37669.1 mini-circle protein [Luteipulveratus halotolerans]